MLKRARSLLFVAAIAAGSSPAYAADKLDILFVVDDSMSMAEEQAALAANFDAFIQELESQLPTLPDIHIGVTTPDLGTHPGGGAKLRRGRHWSRRTFEQSPNPGLSYG
jgi:hypothetical protein